MAEESSQTLFDDIFDVVEVNPEGKKFDKVSRLKCKGETQNVDLRLDVATDVYPMKQGDRFIFTIVSTLRKDGKPDDGTYDQSDEPSLLDDFDYGMAGKVFNYEYEKDSKVTVQASFGGLLMYLHGAQRQLAGLEIDQRIYVLIRKASR